MSGLAQVETWTLVLWMTQSALKATSLTLFALGKNRSCLLLFCPAGSSGKFCDSLD